MPQRISVVGRVLAGELWHWLPIPPDSSYSTPGLLVSLPQLWHCAGWHRNSFGHRITSVGFQIPPHSAMGFKEFSKLWTLYSLKCDWLQGFSGVHADRPLPWCCMGSLPLLRMPILYFSVSTPCNSCCCLIISSSTQELFFWKIPERGGEQWE